ncbi:phosphatidate cytidylyltransferase [Parvularcula bermudensis HTCC2503]|uniref:Phosphatidate cytidylyltransferase n=1 Tax=Parvularcula bermudensis (strain ATCC BAA-594 / HTCC2503 / KCTC 12087) TaxID=314260 RepID=E0TCD6_PARBH|nr:phosphatidate cytidylyltransferase [Parvularcula bermudensis HTCC2503]
MEKRLGPRQTRQGRELPTRTPITASPSPLRPPGAAPRLRGLITRIVTAGLLVPLALGIVWWGGPAFSALIAFMLIILIFEWARIVDRAEFSRGFYTLSLTAFATVFFAAGGAYGLASLIAIFGGGIATLLERRRKAAVSWPLIGAIYLLLPAVAVLFIRHDGGLAAAVLLFVVVWATDSGAYLVGTFLGGPKFWPALSPNKTWAGVLGGLMAGSGTALLLGQVLSLPPLIAPLWLVAAGLSLATLIGDLLESALKRAYDIKDTGGAFPGHGGVLDRLDGFIFAAVILAFLLLIGQE